MKLIYVGPIDAVDVPLSDGTLVTAVRGEPVEVPDEFAARLLAQETWQAVPPPARGERNAKKDGE